MSDIHQDQLRHGREQSFSSSQRPRFPAKAKKPQGHEAFLKMLEASEAEVELVLTSSGESVFGTIKHSDHYTISIKPDTGGTRVFFKHALESFEPTDKGRTDPADAATGD